MTAEDYLESSHKLRVQQQTTREEEEDRADEFEVEELNNLRQASVFFSRTPRPLGSVVQKTRPTCYSTGGGGEGYQLGAVKHNPV